MTRLLVGIALLAGVLASACGSSDEPETTQTEREPDVVLERMPEVPAPSEANPPPESLRDVFDDAQALWHGSSKPPAPSTRRRR